MTVRLRWFTITIKRYYLVYLLVATIAALIFSYALMKTDNFKSYAFFKHASTTLPTNVVVLHAKLKDELISKELLSNSEFRTQLLKEKVERLSKRFKKSRSIILSSRTHLMPNYNVHVFYYAWYGNKKTDGQYKHWNHNYLPNWKRQNNKIYPTGFHEPPLDIGSNYYPLLGCYSSRNFDVINTHMKQIHDAGIGVVLLSWAPPQFKDSPYDITPIFFETANQHKLKVALHVEPYSGRNPINLLNHLKSFFKQFRHHPALYTIKKPLQNQQIPVVYIYDSYLIPAAAWREILSAKGNLSIRNTDLDAIFIGLLVEMQHRYHVKKSAFDGFYTYFATNSFTYGSTWKNWKSLSKFANQNGLIFIPSVGPGYIDTQVRAWNTANTRHRRHGQYYDVAWRSALNSQINFVSITSFNEWHEGTQIEPAQSKTVTGFTYLDYEPEGAYYYLNLTKFWIEQFNKTETLG